MDGLYLLLIFLFALLTVALITACRYLGDKK